MYMISFLRAFVRHHKKNKFHFFLNLFSLSLGLLVLINVALMTQYELSFENMHSRADRIFRITMHNHANQYDMHWARADRDYINRIEDELPGVEALIRFQDYHPRDVRVGEDAFRVEHSFSTDPDVFSVFDFQLVAGNPETALSNPNQTVITESMSLTLFGTPNGMGEEIWFQGASGQERYVVTGIMEDLPPNTHLPVNMLTSFPSEEARTGWAYIYLLLDSPGYVKEVQKTLPSLIRQYGGEETPEDISFPLQSLSSIHLESQLAREIVPNNRWEYIWIFVLVGLVVLVLTMANYINLLLAESIERLKAVRIRLIMGKARNSLYWGLIGESVVMVIVSALIAALLFGLVRTAVQDVTPLAEPGIVHILAFLVLSLLIGVACKAYPSAFVLRKSFTFNNRTETTGDRSMLSMRNILVGIQLVLCVVTVSAVLILQGQFEFMTARSQSSHGDQVLAIRDLPESIRKNPGGFQAAIAGQSGVISLSRVMEVPSREIRDAGPVTMQGANWSDDQLPVMDIQVADKAFFQTMGYSVLAGKLFTGEPEYPDTSDLLTHLTTQSREYVINETALKMLGLDTPEEAVGKVISWQIGDIKLKEGPVIAVVRDFHQESLRNTIDPLVIIQEPVWTRNLLVRVGAGETGQVQEAIKASWNAFAPDYPLQIEFVDDLFARQYSRENNQLTLMQWLTTIVIILSVSGILALFYYLVRTREKEFAIRKVLGAGMRSLSFLLTRRLCAVFLAGVAVAIPVTLYLVRLWMDQYAYRTEISPAYFIISVLLVMLVLLMTSAWMLRRVDTKNPVLLLRSE